MESSMKLKLTKKAIAILNGMLRMPHEMIAGARVQGMQPYPIENAEESQKIVSLQRWMEKKVMVPIKDEKTGETTGYEFQGYEGHLKNGFALILKKMIKHYKDLGTQYGVAEGYFELDAAMHGKKAFFDDPEDPEDEELEDPEEDKAKAGLKDGEHAEGEEAA